MLSRIIDVCARNRFLVFTAVLLLTLAGIWSLQHVPLDALPDISDVQVIVHTAWAGEPPDVIEEQSMVEPEAPTWSLASLPPSKPAPGLAPGETAVPQPGCSRRGLSGEFSCNGRCSCNDLSSCNDRSGRTDRFRAIHMLEAPPSTAMY